MKIPFNKISLSKDETTFLLDAAKNVGSRKYTDLCSQWIKNEFDTETVYMTSSGTSALELALLPIITEEKNEVIMPSFTFPSVGNAIIACGGKPVFCEVDPKTLCLDVKDYANKINDKTIAVVPVHYGGISHGIDEIISISRKNNVYVIEDAAHGFLAYNKNRPLGTIGDFGFYSFHATKNIGCGDGGALLVNTDDYQIKQKIAYYYHNGTNREEYFQGKATNYNWKSYGLNPYPAELAMGFLYGQLANVHENTKKRHKVFKTYYDFFKKNHKDYPIIESFTQENEDIQSNHHIFFITFKSIDDLQYVISEMDDLGIQSQFHFMPLHSSEMAKSFGYKNQDLPITDSISRRILRLPIFNDMSIDEVNYVTCSLDNILRKATNE